MATTIIKPSGEVTSLRDRSSVANSDIKGSSLHEGSRQITDRTGELLHGKHEHHKGAEDSQRQSRRAEKALVKANQNIDRSNRRAQRRVQKEHERVVTKNAQVAALTRQQQQEREEQAAMRAAGRAQLDQSADLANRVNGSSNGRAILLHGSAAENPLLDPVLSEQLRLELELLNQPGVAVEREGRAREASPAEALALADKVGVAPVLAAEAELVLVSTQLANPELVDPDQRRQLEEQLDLINFGIEQSAMFALVQGPSIPRAMAKDIEHMLVEGIRTDGFMYVRGVSSDSGVEVQPTRMPSFASIFKPTEVGASFAQAA